MEPSAPHPAPRVEELILSGADVNVLNHTTLSLWHFRQLALELLPPAASAEPEDDQGLKAPETPPSRGIELGEGMSVAAVLYEQPVDSVKPEKSGVNDAEPTGDNNNGTERPVLQLQGVTTHIQGQLTPNTRVAAVFQRYRCVLCLDASPSILSIDPSSGRLFLELLYESVELFIWSMLRPMEGYIVTPSNAAGFLQLIKERFQLIENDWASQAQERGQWGYLGNATPASLDWILQNAVFALNSLPTDCTPMMVLVTDGVVDVRDAYSYDNLLMQLVRHDIQCHFLRIGGGAEDELNAMFGFVPDTHLLRFVAEYTGGTVFDYVAIHEACYGTTSTCSNVVKKMTGLQDSCFLRKSSVHANSAPVVKLNEMDSTSFDVPVDVDITLLYRMMETAASHKIPPLSPAAAAVVSAGIGADILKDKLTKSFETILSSVFVPIAGTKYYYFTGNENTIYEDLSASEYDLHILMEDSDDGDGDAIAERQKKEENDDAITTGEEQLSRSVDRGDPTTVHLNAEAGADAGEKRPIRHRRGSLGRELPPSVDTSTEGSSGSEQHHANVEEDAEFNKEVAVATSSFSVPFFFKFECRVLNGSRETRSNSADTHAPRATPDSELLRRSSSTAAYEDMRKDMVAQEQLASPSSRREEFNAFLEALKTSHGSHRYSNSADVTQIAESFSKMPSGRIALRLVTLTLPNERAFDGSRVPSHMPFEMDSSGQAGKANALPSMRSHNFSTLHLFQRQVLTRVRKDIKEWCSVEILSILKSANEITPAIGALVQRLFDDLPEHAVTKATYPLEFVGRSQEAPVNPLDLFKREFEKGDLLNVHHCNGVYFVVEKKNSGDKAVDHPDAGFEIPYWAYFELASDHVSLRFHHPDRFETSSNGFNRLGVLTRLQLGVRAVCRRVNQFLLLLQLHETRACNGLLLPANGNLPSSPRSPKRRAGSQGALDATSGQVKQGSFFWPGQFECDLRYSAVFKLHERLAPNFALNMLCTSALEQFQVHNRRHIFVYRDRDGHVFYMKISIFYDNALPPAVGSQPTEERQERSGLARSNTGGSSGGGATSSTTTTTTSGIRLEVFGVSEAGEEVTHELCRLLERKLDEATQVVLMKLLARNTKFQLSPTDLAFLCPPAAEPSSTVDYILPREVADCCTLLHYLSQTLKLTPYIRPVTSGGSLPSRNPRDFANSSLRGARRGSLVSAGSTVSLPNEEAPKPIAQDSSGEEGKDTPVLQDSALTHPACFGGYQKTLGEFQGTFDVTTRSPVFFSKGQKVEVKSVASSAGKAASASPEIVAQASYVLNLNPDLRLSQGFLSRVGKGLALMRVDLIRNSPIKTETREKGQEDTEPLRVKRMRDIPGLAALYSHDTSSEDAVDTAVVVARCQVWIRGSIHTKELSQVVETFLDEALYDYHIEAIIKKLQSSNGRQDASSDESHVETTSVSDTEGKLPSDVDTLVSLFKTLEKRWEAFETRSTSHTVGMNLLEKLASMRTDEEMEEPVAKEVVAHLVESGHLLLHQRFRAAFVERWVAAEVIGLSDSEEDGIVSGRLCALQSCMDLVHLLSYKREFVFDQDECSVAKLYTEHTVLSMDAGVGADVRGIKQQVAANLEPLRLEVASEFYKEYAVHLRTLGFRRLRTLTTGRTHARAFPVDPNVAASEGEIPGREGFSEYFYHPERAAAEAGGWKVGAHNPSHEPLSIVVLEVKCDNRGVLLTAVLVSLHDLEQQDLRFQNRLAAKAGKMTSGVSGARVQSVASWLRAQLQTQALIYGFTIRYFQQHLLQWINASHDFHDGENGQGHSVGKHLSEDDALVVTPPLPWKKASTFQNVVKGLQCFLQAFPDPPEEPKKISTPAPTSSPARYSSSKNTVMTKGNDSRASGASLTSASNCSELIMVQILLRYIACHGSRYEVLDLLQFGTPDAVVCHSSSGSFFHRPPSTITPSTRTVGPLGGYSLVITTQPLTRKPLDKDSVQLLLLKSTPSELGVGNGVLPVERALQEAQLFTRELFRVAAQHYERDLLWSRLLFEDSRGPGADVARTLALPADLFRVEVGPQQLEECLRLSICTPLEALDPRLDELLRVSGVCWQELALRLRDIYADQLREFQFQEEDENSSHLLLLCPDTFDLIIHLTFITPKDPVIPPEQREASVSGGESYDSVSRSASGNGSCSINEQFSEGGEAEGNVRVEICRREETTNKQFTFAQRRSISEFVNSIVHWQWRSLIYD
ncbi:hypothetical protein JG688_00008088 [Phytophthora aleatoria]|uniref:Uncharacterized protein n=1 Tax=Phytophthora aleatoria TaxID=2496075 RepID=A0A8J5M4V9_9STRA|nr:hypothetical protein JG688_00008088 [Phytophthora aleatoria]